VKSEKRLELKLMLSTLTMVLALGYFVASSIIEKPQKSQKIEIAQVSQRGPASLSNQKQLPVYKFSKSVTLNVTCEDKQKTQEVFGAHLRLVGQPCNNTKEIQIKNISNGFTASVIYTKKSNFTTDYIDLSEGENLIQVERIDDYGQSQKNELRIKRILASE
jgi:formate dehydrogenase assembly factor FdhD